MIPAPERERDREKLKGKNVPQARFFMKQNALQARFMKQHAPQAFLTQS